jgi:putative tricarboxylic transport membrane protein
VPQNTGAIAFALALIALSAVGAWQVSLIPQPAVVSYVGPSAMPAAVVGLLAALSLGYLLLVVFRRGEDPGFGHEDTPLEGGGGRMAWLMAGLMAMLILIPIGGVGPACLASFVLVARAFDSRRPVRDALAGMLVVLSLWVIFDRLLGVQLGPLVRGVF